MSITRAGFVMINPEGLYAIPVYQGGGFGSDKSPNTVEFTDDLNRAHVFTDRERVQKPYEAALKAKCQELAAHSVRVVVLGEPDV